MQHFSSEQIKHVLLSTIDSLLDQRQDFLVNPQSDFSRTKKISFEQTILFPMVAGSDNVTTELLDFFGEDKLPLPSAMSQRRSQVKPDAFKCLFSLFTQHVPVQNKFHGYQLVACDGSRLNLPYNPSDPDTFIRCIKDRKGINQMHLNSLYDPLNDVFLDIELQGIHQMDEKGAFCKLLGNLAHSTPGRKRIFLADRGYASYNIFAHAIHQGEFFLIRVPDSFAKKVCFDRQHWLEAPYADETVSVNIGRRNTKKNRQLENYHNIPKRGHYDFLKAGTDDTDCLRLRILKFPIAEDSFEFIITNLPKYSFSLSAVKEVYNLRWKQETAFRHLKYAGNMIHIHSLKKDFLIQEIFAKLTLYNFSSFIASAAGTVQKVSDKYTYVLNHTQAQKVCVRYLRGILKDINSLLCRFLVPVRPGRRFRRNLRRQSADALTYR